MKFTKEQQTLALLICDLIHFTVDGVATNYTDDEVQHFIEEAEVRADELQSAGYAANMEDITFCSTCGEDDYGPCACERRYDEAMAQ